MQQNRAESIEAIVNGFGQLKRSLKSYYAQYSLDLDVPAAQLELLLIIHQVQPVSHKALASKLQLTPGAVSQLLDGLDKADYITRTASDSDRRISYVSLSRNGKRKLDEFQAMRKRLFRSAFDALSEQELQVYLQAQQNLLSWLEQNQPNTK